MALSQWQIKNLPAMQETQVLYLGQEDPLKAGMATHSSILAWRIPSIEEPGGLQSMGLKRVRHDFLQPPQTVARQATLFGIPQARVLE